MTFRMVDPKVLDRLAKLVELTVRGDEHEAQVAEARINDVVNANQQAIDDARDDATQDLVLLERLIEKYQIGVVIFSKLYELTIAKLDGDPTLAATAAEMARKAEMLQAKLDEGIRWRTRRQFER